MTVPMMNEQTLLNRQVQRVMQTNHKGLKAHTLVKNAEKITINFHKNDNI